MNLNQLLSELVRDHTTASRVPAPTAVQESARLEIWAVNVDALRAATNQPHFAPKLLR